MRIIYISAMDYRQLASQMLRALRGRRSQVALARRLGYRSNVVYLWESGRALPRASQTLLLAERSGIDVDAAIARFYGRSPDWLAGLGSGPQRHRRLVSQLLEDQRGNVPAAKLARTTGFSRYAVGRWLAGEAQPRLHEFLALLDAQSLRVLDFVAAFVDPAQLPSAAEAWARIEAARHAAYDLPWSNAVLRALELRAYAALPTHEPGWLADQIGIELAVEQACLEALQRAGQVEVDAQGRYRVHAARVVDTSTEPAAALRLKRWWSAIAAQRASRGVEGHFGYNLFACARADVPKLVALQRAYYQELRRLVAASEPSEVLMLAGTQLLDLAAHAPAQANEAQAAADPPDASNRHGG